MKTMTTEQIKERVNNGGPILVNTLSPADYEKAHIPNSVNIPGDSDDFVQQVEETIGGKDQPVIVYCASKQCPSSEQAAEKLERAGFKDVYDYEGGTQEWQEAGEEVAASR